MGCLIFNLEKFAIAYENTLPMCYTLWKKVFFSFKKKPYGIQKKKKKEFWPWTKKKKKKSTFKAY